MCCGHRVTLLRGRIAPLITLIIIASSGMGLCISIVSTLALFCGGVIALPVHAKKIAGWCGDSDV